MRKFILLTLFSSPLMAWSQNPPPPGLPDQPVVLTIDSSLYLLLSTGILFGFVITITKVKVQSKNVKNH